MAAVTLTEVRAGKRGAETLCGVSFAIPDAAFCVILTTDSAAASTLIRLIAGDERPSNGEIVVGEAALGSFGGAAHGLAEFVDPSVLHAKKHLYANIERGLRRRGVPKAEVEARVLAAADALALGPVLAQKAWAATPDERWRTVFGRALAHRPPVLLFDEPLAGVEPARRMALRRAFRRIQRESGATAIYATQHAEDAFALADLLVVLNDGVVEQAGSPADVYAAPANVTVARIAGPFGINLLPVRTDHLGLSLDDGTTLGAAGLRTAARHAVLGVRPEHLFALGDSAPTIGARFPLAVDAVEPTGADSFLHGRVGGHAVTARLPGFAAVQAGSTLLLGAKEEHLHLFDAETGAAVGRPAAQTPTPRMETPPKAVAAPPSAARPDREDDDAAERALHERRLAAARARLSR